MLVVQEVAAVSRIEASIKVAKLQVFNGTAENVSEFIMIYKLYIRIKMKKDAVEE